MSRENQPSSHSSLLNEASTQKDVLPRKAVTVELTAASNAAPDPRLSDAARLILVDFGIRTGSVSLAIVDDPTIHELNRRYLHHDYPTDVLSFVYQQQSNHLEGEVIVSADTAARVATRYGWSLCDELLLYIIHGTLHLVGLDDQNDQDRAKMRQWESKYLRHFGLAPQRIDDADQS